MIQASDSADQRGRTANQNARAFQQVLRDVFGVPFALYDASTGWWLENCSAQGVMLRPEIDAPAVIELATAGQAVVVPCEENAYRLSLVLQVAGKPALVAVGTVAALAETPAARATELARLRAWARDFSERLRLRDQLSVRAKVEEELRGQVGGAWKVNLVLGECMQRLRFNRHELRDRRRVLHSAWQLLDAEALAWVPLPPEPPLIVGKCPISEEELGRLAGDLMGLHDTDSQEPYLCNDPRGAPWGYGRSAVENLLAFWISGPPSWLMALNKNGKALRASDPAPRAPFRTSDAALLSPFVNMLMMHSRAAGKFDELRGLLVGLARSLTAAIDAKDAYTAGHSERVARLATEIGREMQLPEEQISDLYLAGLLHDVGKIGIREVVLSKPGKLTPEEFEHVKQHVTIGHGMLQYLRPIRHLLPGVLYHHERWDGKGYPEGLAGENIPFLARLLAVADGFDAMNSQRPYRAPLALEQVFDELRSGSGTQWDPQVVTAALRCSGRLGAISERGLGDSLCQAVTGVLRPDSSSLLDV